METGSVNLWEDCVQCDTDTQKINHLASLVINQKSNNDFYTSKEVSEILNISLTTLNNYCSQGLIAYSKPQRKRYFFKEDINEYLKTYRVRSRN